MLVIFLFPTQTKAGDAAKAGKKKWVLFICVFYAPELCGVSSWIFSIFWDNFEGVL